MLGGGILIKVAKQKIFLIAIIDETWWWVNF